MKAEHPAAKRFVNIARIYCRPPILRFVQHGLCRQGARPNSRVLCVYYHCVSNAPLAHLKHLYAYKNVRQFNRDLEIFEDSFEPLEVNEFLNHTGIPRSKGKHPILITFDDGLREIYDVVAPLLLRKGIPATFFITRDFIDNRFLCYHHRASILLEEVGRLDGKKKAAIEKEVRRHSSPTGRQNGELRDEILRAAFHNRPLIDRLARMCEVDFDSYLDSVKPYVSSEQLGALAKWGFGLGGHATDHSHFAHLSVAEQIRQTEDSVVHLKEKLGLKYGVFSFPHGDGGVASVFFERLRKRGLVDLCFGTRGFVRDREAMLHQRLNLERPLLRADMSILRHLVRAVGRVVTGRFRVRRE